MVISGCGFLEKNTKFPKIHENHQKTKINVISVKTHFPSFFFLIFFLNYRKNHKDVIFPIRNEFWIFVNFCFVFFNISFFDQNRSGFDLALFVFLAFQLWLEKYIRTPSKPYVDGKNAIFIDFPNF